MAARSRLREQTANDVTDVLAVCSPLRTVLMTVRAQTVATYARGVVKRLSLTKQVARLDDLCHPPACQW
jgi:hypothetical protein